MSKFIFKKRYGQNFLENDNIAEDIVNSISPSSKDLIIEIGPGAGAITKKLKKYSAQILAFEIDLDTKQYLSKIEDEKTKIIYEDFLNANIKDYLSKMSYEKIYIIGNLPYYITTPILEHIIESDIDEESVTIMVQKEVGERFTAKPHSRDYGYMTVLLNYSYNIEKIVDVPRNNFYPVPNVDSIVIKLTRKEKPNIDYNKFKSILKESFQFKRKTISNNLKSISKDKLEEILSKNNLTLSSRAEDIDLNTFIEIVESANN